jgi:hypothetical protein
MRLENGNSPIGGWRMSAEDDGSIPSSVKIHAFRKPAMDGLFSR